MCDICCWDLMKISSSLVLRPSINTDNHSHINSFYLNVPCLQGSGYRSHRCNPTAADTPCVVSSAPPSQISLNPTSAANWFARQPRCRHAPATQIPARPLLTPTSQQSKMGEDTKLHRHRRSAIRHLRDGPHPCASTALAAHSGNPVRLSTVGTRTTLSTRYWTGHETTI